MSIFELYCDPLCMHSLESSLCLSGVKYMYKTLQNMIVPRNHCAHPGACCLVFSKNSEDCTFPFLLDSKY